MKVVSRIQIPKESMAEMPVNLLEMKLRKEIQSVVIHALVTVYQGLVGAVLAEFLRPANAHPDQGNAGPSRHREDVSSENGELEKWSDSDARQQSEWGGRL